MSEQRVEFRADGPDRFMVQIMGPPAFIVEQMAWMNQVIGTLVPKKPAELPLLDHSIDELELSVRSYTALKNARCTTVRDILQVNPALHIKNFGKKSIKEVRSCLAELGIKWGYQEEDKANGHQAQETGSNTRTSADLG